MFPRSAIRSTEQGKPFEDKDGDHSADGGSDSDSGDEPQAAAASKRPMAEKAANGASSNDDDDSDMPELAMPDGNKTLLRPRANTVVRNAGGLPIASPAKKRM